MTDNQATRPLTVEESARLMRKLTIAIGHQDAMTALSVIAGLGAGIFMPDHENDE